MRRKNPDVTVQRAESSGIARNAVKNNSRSAFIPCSELVEDQEL
jgi:hypothetical protein